MISVAEILIEKAEVVSVPGIMGGEPVLKGTRVPAEVVRQSLLAGDSRRSIFLAYPRLPVGSVEAVISWANEQGLPCSSS